MTSQESESRGFIEANKTKFLGRWDIDFKQIRCICNSIDHEPKICSTILQKQKLHPHYKITITCSKFIIKPVGQYNWH